MNDTHPHWLRWLTIMGLGHLRPFPGTWGSLPPAALAALVLAVAPGSVGWTLMRLLMLALAVLFTLACGIMGDRAEAHFNRKDPSPVVADEVAGMALCLMLMPSMPLRWPAVGSVVMALAFFRVVDVVKPWPADRLQRAPGGWGIVLDDLAAGLLAALVLWLSYAIAVL
ncbi:MAG: phosphatidylglycerophosphatase A [Phycisphaerales bacterium]|nr:MAG: phosphatidylglycerophosphatase A [Phycisphaerales bacterium]